MRIIAPERPCKICGILFVPKQWQPSWDAKGWGICCGKSCATKLRAKPLILRFLKHVLIGDGCWEWQAGRTIDGYGRIAGIDGIRNKKILAHRFSYEYFTGSIPDGLFVLHKCDNPPCVRPGHLFLGTKADNSKDASRKGRLHGAGENHFKGEMSPGAKLTDAEVIIIRSLYASGLKVPSIQKQFNHVSCWTLYDVVSRRIWKHI